MGIEMKRSMRCVAISSAGIPIALFLTGWTAWAADNSKPPVSVEWNPVLAAKYLDRRAKWWETWPRSQRDHDTACISCHTTLPYALARPKLASLLQETATPEVDRTVLGNVEKRVSLWNEVEPYYTDARSGPGKSKQSRSTEAVLNAVVLAEESARKGHMTDLSRKAFRYAWDLQIKEGPDAGSWDWQIFKLSPWEATESRYEGATWFARAVAEAPDRYTRDPAVIGNMKLLRAYLRANYSEQPLINKLVLVWASDKCKGLITKAEKREILATASRQQNGDGGWSLASLGNWNRSDHTAESKDSDGFATGLVTLVFSDAGDNRYRSEWAKGREWLVRNQNADGSWRGVSVNKQRDLATDAGKFMSDAATSYAVMALTLSRSK